MARRSKRPEHDNHERWLISYADFITLLFSFFVVMYAISSLNEGKYKVLSASLASVFGETATPQSNSPVSLSEQDRLMKSLVDRRNAKQGERARKQQEYMRSVANNLNQVLASQVSSGQVSVTQSNRGVVLDINASALFNQGEAELQSESVKTMSEVARILGQGDQAIEVEGHTDDVPIKNPRFPSNWELSSARASSVVRLFIEHGVAADRLTAVGSAANRPIASNDTLVGRARNRRVTVTILSPALERAAQQPTQ
ncbi:MAG: flagellar motor protein MotD [Nitrosomonadales bacterium]|nr:flagellar motor protein MotD [Nitrosomonadales bacterium]